MNSRLKFKNILAGMLLTSASLSADGLPFGNLDALEQVVRIGDTSKLAWQISYPPQVTDEKTETDVIMKVRVITCAIGPRHTVDFGVSLNNSSYQRFYQGVSEENPAYTLESGSLIAETLVSANTEIEVLASHSANILPGTNWVSSRDPSQEHMILKLKNGDPVPIVPGVRGQRSVAEILAPYSEDGIVKIGENETIHCYEIFTNNPSHVGFDLQDLVLLISYEQVSIDG